MSTNLAYANPVRRRADEETLAPVPRRVRIVTTREQRRARPKLVYALGAIVVIFAIFLTQLLITIALSSGAYRIDDLQATQQTLGRSTSALGERLDTLGSTQNLEANALALGMVASSNAALLQLSNGAVLGSAAPATATAAATDPTTNVSNSLLTDVPLIKIPAALTQPTGTGHGGGNASNSTTGTTQSTQGQDATAQVGQTTQTSPTVPDSGALPSPVTH